MGIFMKLLKPLFNAAKRRSQIDDLKRERRELDSRIERLTKATMNGDEEWFLKVVRRNPSCALRIVKECGKNAKSD